MDLNKTVEFIEWHSDWTTGNDLMDSQHKTLIKYINDMILLSRRSNVSVEEISELFDKIKDYTVYHFDAEEKLLSWYNYIHLDRHKKIHKKLIQQLEKIEMKFQQVGIKIIPVLLNFLSLWLQEHILGVDRKYSQVVSQRDTPY